LDPARCQVLRNAAGPPFVQLFADGRAAAAAKVWPPLLAYTSTPFRGLELLLDVFPAVRRAVPGTELQVFSSMQVYHVSAAKDSADYGHLYRRCLEIEGVEYVGSLPQPELAQALAGVTMLAYPNHFAETSCIAVMEALAAGLRVVTSQLGALPETTAGFASLVAVDGDWPGYRQRFAAEVIRVLETIAADKIAAQDHLSRQIALVQQSGTWQHRARGWSDWLSAIVADRADS
jgi:glycosyltransferase involved in cell wall biosynthesis